MFEVKKMVTRFSASEARLKAEQAKKKLEEQLKRDKELKKTQAKVIAGIRAGYDSQRETIISAAIDGNTEIEVDSVYLFRELVDLGIQVVEEGLVKRQNKSESKDLDTDWRDHSKAEILDHFDKFIDDAKGDLKSYYGGLQRFHKLNYDALYEAMSSDWRWRDFAGDEIYIEEVPDNLKARYSSYIAKINEKIRKYRLVVDVEAEYIDDDFDEYELITGEYFFSEDDEYFDVLLPSLESNKLKIKWSSEQGSTFMNAPLLSAEGLAWLSSYRGQSLIELVFETLSEAAEQGMSSIKLDFSLTNDGWNFLYKGRKIYCCMPDELVGIIELQNFTIDDSSSKSNSYFIKVSW
jgi:hypothetical protein